MNDERLLTISTFARAVGVPATALRFYAGEGVLVPAEVDAVTGYRYYSPSQIDAGVLVGRLRSAGVAVPVMKDILYAGLPERARLVDQIIASHSARSRRREEDLVALRESLHDTARAHQNARAVLWGRVLASAMVMVFVATSEASDDVSGLVWSLRDGHLELIATDRYWLAHRRLPVRHGEGAARAMTTAEAASSFASACAHLVDVHVEIDGGRLRLLDSGQQTLEETASVDRAVPDLGLLVSTQPPVRAVAGFAVRALDELLERSAADQHVIIDGSRAVISSGDQSLPGWAAADADTTGPLRIQLQSALLESTVSICTGPEVVLGVVDVSTPVRVGSPLQDTMTCLVMPMRP